jgi:hypothetical protein
MGPTASSLDKLEAEAGSFEESAEKDESDPELHGAIIFLA